MRQQLQRFVRRVGAGGEPGLGADRDIQFQSEQRRKFRDQQHPGGHVGSSLRAEGDTFIDCGGPQGRVRLYDPQREFVLYFKLYGNPSKINSDGTTSQVGQLVPFTAETVILPGVLPPNNTEMVPVVPGMMSMDPAGKFLFVADRTTTDPSQLFVSGAVSVFAIGSGGTLTEVAGSPFLPTPQSIVPEASLDIISVAPTPTVFPAIGLNGVQNSVCSTAGLNPPTTQYLYAVDKLGNQVFEFAVNTSTGVLTNPSSLMQEPAFSADALPVAVAVDACDRFVYVTGSLNGRVNAYTMCNGGPNQSSTRCPQTPDGSLVEVAGSPFSLAGSNIQAGPLVVDPFGNYVYVLGTHSNSINILKIAPVSGALTASNPATVATGLGPTSIAIRADDNWLFVTNFNGPSVSQYSITPATGALTVLPAIQTDNYPWGVAVK